MKSLLAFALALPLAASTVQIDQSFMVQTDLLNCGSQEPCAPLTIEIPRTLDPLSISWTLTGGVDVHEGIGDMYVPAGLSYTVSWTEGILAPDFNLDATATQTSSGVTNGSGTQIGAGGWWTGGSLSASGTVTNLSEFTGTGFLALLITPFAITTSSTLAVGAGVTNMQDEFNLVTHTIDDPPDVVPEPRWLGLLAVGLVGLMGYYAKNLSQ